MMKVWHTLLALTMLFTFSTRPIRPSSDDSFLTRIKEKMYGTPLFAGYHSTAQEKATAQKKIELLTAKKDSIQKKLHDPFTGTATRRALKAKDEQLTKQINEQKIITGEKWSTARTAAWTGFSTASTAGLGYLGYSQWQALQNARAAALAAQQAAALAAQQAAAQQAAQAAQALQNVQNAASQAQQAASNAQQAANIVQTSQQSAQTLLQKTQKATANARQAKIVIGNAIKAIGQNGWTAADIQPMIQLAQNANNKAHTAATKATTINFTQLGPIMQSALTSATNAVNTANNAQQNAMQHAAQVLQLQAGTIHTAATQQALNQAQQAVTQAQNSQATAQAALSATQQITAQITTELTNVFREAQEATKALRDAYPKIAHLIEERISNVWVKTSDGDVVRIPRWRINYSSEELQSIVLQTGQSKDNPHRLSMTQQELSDFINYFSIDVMQQPIIARIESRIQPKVLSGHIDSINTVAFNSTGTKIISGSSGAHKTLMIWDTKSQQRLYGVKHFPAPVPVLSAAFNPYKDQIAVVLQQRSNSNFSLYLDAIETTDLFLVPIKDVKVVAFNNNGHKLLCTTSLDTASLIDTSNGKILLTFENIKAHAIAWSPDDNNLCALGRNTVYLYNTQTNTSHELPGNFYDPVNAIVFSNDAGRSHLKP